MKTELTEYAGWKNCLRISNGKVEIVATLDVGPRIIRFARIDGENIFKEFADQCGQTGGDEWLSYGGHRLWHAPEVMPWTYYPDNHPVAHTWENGILTLTPPEEASNHLQLQMAIALNPDQPLAKITHRITNTGTEPVELAPWCLSVMAGGGRAVFPQEDFIPHGESFSPARPIVLWHFTNMNDPRLTWGEKLIQVREDPGVDRKLKIGAMNSKGWAAYLLKNDVFIKHFPCEKDAAYTDMGCNCEFYTQPGMLEIESIGPLSKIEPGSSIEHEESWWLASADIGEGEDETVAGLYPVAEQSRPRRADGCEKLTSDEI